MMDKRKEELKEVYLALHESNREKLEKIALSLLNDQRAAENESLAVSKKDEE